MEKELTCRGCGKVLKQNPDSGEWFCNATIAEKCDFSFYSQYDKDGEIMRTGFEEGVPTDG